MAKEVKDLVLEADLVRSSKYWYRTFHIKAEYHKGQNSDKLTMTLTGPAGKVSKTYWNTSNCYIGLQTEVVTTPYGASSKWFDEFSTTTSSATVSKTVTIDNGANLDDPSFVVHNTGVSAFPTSVINIVKTLTYTDNTTNNDSGVEVWPDGINYDMSKFTDGRVLIRK